MDTVDDHSDRLRSDEDSSECRVYRTDRASRGSGRLLGEIDGEHLREVLLRHPDACEAFRMISGTGYRDPTETAENYSAAEHSGRVKTDIESVASNLSSDVHSCEVRLDTAGPQLATIRNDTERAQIEFDTARVRWVAPRSVEGSEN